MNKNVFLKKNGTGEEHYFRVRVKNLIETDNIRGLMLGFVKFACP
jgi:hypothetical protein